MYCIGKITNRIDRLPLRLCEVERTAVGAAIGTAVSVVIIP